MVQHQRSRSKRRIKVKTPGGNNVIHYRARKPAKAKCAECGKILPGVPRERPIHMRKMAKTEKRPERPFGGKLCSSCSRKTIKQRVKSLFVKKEA